MQTSEWRGRGDLATTAKQAMQGTLHGAQNVSESAVKSVSGILDTTIDGVKVVAKAPFRKDEGNQG